MNRQQFPNNSTINGNGSTITSAAANNSALSELCHLLRISSADGSAASFVELEKLRDTGDPTFLFLRSILELVYYKQQNDQEILLFHCIMGVRDTFLQKWELFPMNFACLVRDFFFTCGLWGFSTSSTLVIPRAFLTVSAAFWKRSLLFLYAKAAPESSQASGSATTAVANIHHPQLGVLEQHIMLCFTAFPSHHHKFFPLNNAAIPSLMECMDQLILFCLKLGDSNNMHTASMACFFLNTLLGEVSGTVLAHSSSSNSVTATSAGSAARYNLPLEFHRNVFKLYSSEGGLLDFTLQISISALLSISTLLQTNGNYKADEAFIKLAIGITSLANDVLSWDFSLSDISIQQQYNQQHQLLKPPTRWKTVIISPPTVVTEIFHMYSMVRGQIISANSSATTSIGMGQLRHHNTVLAKDSSSHQQISHQKLSMFAYSLRQVLLDLASLSGPIFDAEDEKRVFSEFLVEGCLNVLTGVLLYDDDSVQQEWCEGEAMDFCDMLYRIIVNHKLTILSKNRNYLDFINAMCTVGRQLCSQMLSLVEANHGNVESCSDDIGWREESLDKVLQGAVLLVEDSHWLSIKQPQQSEWLSSLYTTYVHCRTKMARMEEYYLTASGTDLDEVREEIVEQEIEEQMTIVAILGRKTSLSKALECLQDMFVQDTFPRLITFLREKTNNSITAQGAALLEEARLGLVCITHLLTDDASGETPTIPEAIVRELENDVSGAVATLLTSLVVSCMTLAECQASLLEASPNDPKLSPLLGKTLLKFLIRWAPAYIIPEDSYTTTKQHLSLSGSNMQNMWSSQESAEQVVSFCVHLCFQYYCFWSSELQLQDNATKLISALINRGPRMRHLLVISLPWERLVAAHILSTVSVQQSSEKSEEDDAYYGRIANVIPSAMVEGYKRLPFRCRAEIFSTILTGCSSDDSNVKSVTMLNKSLEVVHSLFLKTVLGLGNGTIQSANIHTRDMVLLAIEMYRGIAQSSEIDKPDRIPQFLTPYLSDLSGLMQFYADDLPVCYSLLQLFRDYAERFIAMLSRAQSLTLFQASADLLKAYSEHHCALRRPSIKRLAYGNDFEEEQTFSDVLCAIQLLIHLSSKDFMDIYADVDGNADQNNRVDSSQITDVIFFGLQQIIPLMTQGLLQYPTLCNQYFSLVGFMMDTYPENTCVLPYNLFRSLLDSLLFGMSHVNPSISKSSLTGIRGITVEHLKNGSLSVHLSQYGDILYQCLTRLLNEVVFQPIIWDRLEAASLALMPLIAAHGNSIASLVNDMAQKLDSFEKQQRFISSFAKLITSEVINGGYDLRSTRVQFKKDFEVFVKDIHSFLILK